MIDTSGPKYQYTGVVALEEFCGAVVTSWLCVAWWFVKGSVVVVEGYILEDLWCGEVSLGGEVGWGSWHMSK